MKFVLLSVLLVVGNATGAGMIIPQVVRLHRRRIVDGLSPAWVGVGIVMNLWWVAYAVHGRLWSIAPVSVLGVVLYVLIARQLCLIAGPAVLAATVPTALGFAVVPALFHMVGGWGATGLAIGLSYGVQFMPAAEIAVRAVRLEGISPLTWILAWIEAVAWLVYGVVTVDPALLVGGAGGTLMASVILACLAQAGAARPDRSRPSPRPLGASSSTDGLVSVSPGPV